MNQEMQPKVTDEQPIVTEETAPEAPPHIKAEVKAEVFAALDEASVDLMADVEPEIELTDEEERRAQEIAVENTSAWMKNNPSYTMDQLSKAKARFLETARASFRKARAKNTDTNGNH